MARFAVYVSLLFPAAMLAQETRGSLNGVVADPSGAAVASATVTVTNVQTGVSNQTKTNEAGVYTLLYLLAGPYRVAVEAPGFKRLVREGIELRVGDRVTLNLTLDVGAVQESVNVTGEAPLLEVSTASSGQVIDRRRIAELPLAEGNPLTLIRITPGIAVANNNLSSGSALSSSGPSAFEANGSPGGNEFTLDGSPNTADRAGNGSARVGMQPPPDAVEEFRVVTASFDAQQGRTAGASVDVSVRSGTNEVHGTLYHFFRNDALAANTFFNNRQGLPIEARRYNRFGGTVGGPISIPKVYDGRNRTFFFTSYERIRPITPSLETLTVPAQDFRDGDFSRLANRATPLLIYDPATARREGARIVRDPISCGGRLNVICPSRISPIARNYLSFLPLPNTNLAAPTNNFVGNGPGDNDYWVFLLRGDHQFNDKNRMFVRYSKSRRREIDENSAGTVNGVRVNGRLGHRGNEGVVIDHVWVASPSTILNIRSGYTRFTQDRFSLASFDYDIRKMGFSELTLSQFTANTLPQINVTNFSSPVEPTGFNIANPLWSFQPTLTKIAGAHAVRIGYDLRITQENRMDQTFQAGQFNFANDFTRATDQNPSLPLEQLQGQGLAALLLGQPTGGNMPILASRAATAPYQAWFIQDDWKITPRLTVNMGLRYEIDFGTTERFNRIIQTFDPFVTNPVEAAVRANYAQNPIPEIRPEDFRVRGGLIFAGANNRHAFRPDMNNFQPRFGAAYQIGSRTAIRGGWAMFMVPFILDGLNQNGFNRNTPLVPSPDLGLTFTANLANPWPGGLVPQANLGLTSLLGQGVGVITPVNRKNGLVQRWEFSIQHELPGRWLLETSYHANRGFDLVTNVDANPVFRRYQSASPTRDQALINFLDTPVSNPFRGVDGFQGTNLYTASVINRRQLLRPFPHFTSITEERYNGSSSFHSGQLRVEKRFAQGYTVLASYVYSKFLERLNLLHPTDAQYENRLK